MNITTLGIDLAKEIFQLHGVDAKGKTVLKKRLRRDQLSSYIAQLSPCLIGMECSGGSNYWARKFQSFGHEVKLMNPRFVKPYVKSDKNDMNDAEGICEAVSRPNMRFAGVKTVAQQDIQSVHRVRSRLVSNRTGLSNQIRGLLLEHGIAIPKGFKGLKDRMSEILSSEDNELSGRFKSILQDLREEFESIETSIKRYDKQLDRISQEDESCKRLLSIEGIGPITATAMVAMIGDGKQFKNGRQLSAYFGLVPRQFSSGGKEVLGGITKRGDPYIRGLLVHGARALLVASKRRVTRSRRVSWFINKAEKNGHNKAVVAMANKQARVVWAVLTGKKPYERFHEEERVAA